MSAYSASVLDPGLRWPRQLPALTLLQQRQQRSPLVARHRLTSLLDICGYLSNLVGLPLDWNSIVGVPMLEFHIELQMSGRCEDWALHLHPRGWGEPLHSSYARHADFAILFQVCEMWWCAMVWNDVIWFAVIWCDMVSFDVIWCDMMWFDDYLMWFVWILCHLMFYYVIWCRTMWCDVIWFDRICLIWCDKTRYDVTWCNVIWCDKMWAAVIWTDCISCGYIDAIWCDMTWFALRWFALRWYDVIGCDVIHVISLDMTWYDETRWQGTYARVAPRSGLAVKKMHLRRSW